MAHRARPGLTPSSSASKKRSTSFHTQDRQAPILILLFCNKYLPFFFSYFTPLSAAQISSCGWLFSPSHFGSEPVRLGMNPVHICFTLYTPFSLLLV
jgi:hypothetical protein